MPGSCCAGGEEPTLPWLGSRARAECGYAAAPFGGDDLREDAVLREAEPRDVEERSGFVGGGPVCRNVLIEYGGSPRPGLSCCCCGGGCCATVFCCHSSNAASLLAKLDARSGSPHSGDDWTGSYEPPREQDGLSSGTSEKRSIWMAHTQICSSAHGDGAGYRGRTKVHDNYRPVVSCTYE